jgi:hypothetical protein
LLIFWDGENIYPTINKSKSINKLHVIHTTGQFLFHKYLQFIDQEEV